LVTEFTTPPPTVSAEYVGEDAELLHRLDAELHASRPAGPVERRLDVGPSSQPTMSGRAPLIDMRAPKPPVESEPPRLPASRRSRAS
jgi:hypothetical protein